MSRSKGTKETQGINGDAALLQRLQGAAAGTTDRDVTPCPYEEHRATDWHLTSGGPAVCGICHPAASGLHTELVTA